MSDPFLTWVDAAERRYLADLTRAEVGRALRALSSCYVERRSRLAAGAPLASAGKRAAFALFYGPLHFLAVRQIVDRLGLAERQGPAAITDLGCGTGAAGAAWALASGGRAAVAGVDVNAWAVHEAAWTYRTLGVHGVARRVPLRRVDLSGRRSAVLAAFVVNELAAEERAALLPRLLTTSGQGRPVLVVEPIARRLSPWWAEWVHAFEAAGGRADEWRVPVELPRLLRELDHAAGLDHREITARTLLAGAVAVNGPLPGGPTGG